MISAAEGFCRRSYMCARDTRAQCCSGGAPVLLRQWCLAAMGSVLVASDPDFRELSFYVPSFFRDLCAITIHNPTSAICSDAMQVNFLAPFQVILRPKNQFALFFVSYFTAKLLHLGSHVGSLPVLLYLLYFPTFILPDVLLLVSSKILVYRHNGSQQSIIRRSIGAFLA